MKTLLLVGGGHAHLHLIKTLQNTNTDWNIILISPSRHQYYSGMFSGFTEGLYSKEDIRVDLTHLAAKSNIEFIVSTVEQIDPITQFVRTKEGNDYFYDVISFNIGSQTRPPIEQDDLNIPIKPNFRFPTAISSLRDTENPVIVGGGSSGIELALAVQAWRRYKKLHNPVTLISSHSLLASQHPKISKEIMDISSEKGINLIVEQRVVKQGQSFIYTDKEEKIPYSNVLWLTGPNASPLFKTSGLKTDGQGFLSVNRYLQHVHYPNIFGAGDCVSIIDYPSLPKNGVYAIRQSPILSSNIKALLLRKPLISFKPQKKFLSILSTGNREGFLIYGDFSYHGKLTWFMKNKIDTRFLQKYQK